MMRRNQKGMALIELLVATAVAGMLMGGAVPSIFQIINTTEQGNARLTALQAIQNASRWISQDVRMSQTTSLVDGAKPVDSLTLTWIEWQGSDSVSHSISYSLLGSKLQRDYDGNITTVAQYLSNIEFSLANRVVIVTITSAPCGDSGPSEKRTYHVTLRPDES